MTTAIPEPGDLPNTPYLNRELPLPSPNRAYRRIRPWQTALIILAFALVTPFEIYLLILAVTLIHEFGHCVAGLMVGLEFDQMRVGPVEVDSYGRSKWVWNWGTIVGGHSLMLPKDKSALRVRLAGHIAGGPVANVLSGLLVLHLIPDSNSPLMGLAQVFVGGSLVVGLGNLIPFRKFGVSSDGMKLGLLMLNKGQRWIFLLNRQAAIKRGEVEDVLDPAFASKSDGSSDYVGANWVAYTAADGKGNYDLAANYLEACLAKCSTVTPDFREELILAAARFQATRRRNNDLAWQWFKSGNREKSKINRACTEALILYSEGKIDEALSKAHEGSNLVAQLPAGTMKNLQEKAWMQLRQVIENGAVTSVVVSDTRPSDVQ
jgi:hypothetical protein